MDAQRSWTRSRCALTRPHKPLPRWPTKPTRLGHEGARIIAYLSYAHPEPPGPDLATLTGLAAAGRLDPPVGLTLPWTQLRDALTALAERRISGKAVLTVG